MRDRPRRRTAASVHSAAIALLVAAAILGAGYGLQRGLLRPPTRGELLAARIDLGLLRYRLVRSTIHVAGEPRRHAECMESWHRVPGRHAYTRGAAVVFSDGERLAVTRRGIARLTPAHSPGRMPPVAEVQLAGCARALIGHIYAHLVSNRRTHAVQADFMGHPSLSLHIRTKRDRFDVFVDPATLVPLGLRVETAHAIGWSVVDPVRPLTPAIKRDFLRRFNGR